MADEQHPRCWSCGSVDVSVAFDQHRRVYCLKDCDADHAHSREIPTHKLTCRECGNVWIDGSGDFTQLAQA
jgi:hypothetical protein